MASVTKRNGTYTIRVSLGYDGAGRQIQKFKTYRPAPGMTDRQIKKELERQKVLFEEQCQSGQYMSGNIRFSEFVEYWLKEYAEKQLRPKTLDRYQRMLTHIISAIGHIKLNKLQPHHLITFYNNLHESGMRNDDKYIAIRNGKDILKKHKMTQAALADQTGLSLQTIKSFVTNTSISKKSALKISDALDIPIERLFKIHTVNGGTLSPKTILHYHRLISSILEKAVKWQVIPFNPCHRVEAPKVQRKERAYLDEIQATELIKHLDSEPLRYRAMITLLLYSGMRRGEMCGPEWSDIDFKNNLIDINKSSVYTVMTGTVNSETKTESSKRVIKMPPIVIDILRQHKADQAAERLKLGDKWINSNKVFTQANGKAMHPDTITGWFGKFLKRHNLPHIPLHSLRHTNATLLIASGTDLRTVSKRLGHANMSTTANIYTHAIQTADEKAAQAIDDILTLKANKA